MYTGTLREHTKQHAAMVTPVPWLTQGQCRHTLRRGGRACRSAAALAPRGTLAPRPRRALRGPQRLRHDRPAQWSRGDARHTSGPRAAHSPTSAQPPTKHAQASAPLPPALARGSTTARHGADSWRAAAQLAPLEAARRTKSESKNSECPSHAACSSSRRGRGSAAAAAASASAAAASAAASAASARTAHARRAALRRASSTSTRCCCCATVRLRTAHPVSGQAETQAAEWSD